MVKCEGCGKLGTTINIRKEYGASFRGRNFRRSVCGYRCMECRESFIDPAEDQRLEKEYQKFVQEVLEKTKNCTCVKCDRNNVCTYRWDAYNTNGDCLAMK